MMGKRLLIFFGRRKKIPTIDLQLETKTVKVEVRKIEIPPLINLYVPPTDKEMILGLEESEHYEEAFRLKELKKQNMILKGKLTVLQKKYETLRIRNSN